VGSSEPALAMRDQPPRPWHGIHRALADPLRIRMHELLWLGPRSAKELAGAVGLAPDRVYYHLRQLERAGLVEVGGYRPLPGGKVERLYRCAEAEPPPDASSPREVAMFLRSVLDAAKADVSAALMAKEEGRRREVYLGRGAIRLSEAALVDLREQFAALEERWGDAGTAGDDGIWVRTLVALVDLEDRPAAPALRALPDDAGEDHAGES
jgi:DNA-binding transcriptional ArsR family regulator